MKLGGRPAADLAAECCVVVLPAGVMAVLAFRSGGYSPAETAAAGVAAAGVVMAVAALASRPAAHVSRAQVAVALALIALAAWAWASGSWSDAPGRAHAEAVRWTAYATVFLAAGLLARSDRLARWLVAALATAATVAAIAGLAAWLLPGWFAIDPIYQRRRLSWPTGYWNTTGLLAALGLIWCLHLTSSRATWQVRVIAAGALPLLVATAAFTASRGAIGAAIIGSLAYAATARSRLPALAIAACAPALVATLLVVRATGIDGDNVTPALVDEGRRVAAGLVICAIAAALSRAASLAFERRALDMQLPSVTRGTRIGLAAGACLIVLAAAIAAGAPRELDRAYDEFRDGSAIPETTVRSRITNFSSDGRIELWRIAYDAFRPHPLRGSGAGTYALLWSRDRPAPSDAQDAHSLYVETLGELGIPGLALLLVALIGMLAALGRRALAAGPGGSAWGALFAAALAYASFAAVDWSWEMPACTVWLLTAGGLALSPAARPADVRRPVIGAAPRAALLLVGLVSGAISLQLLSAERRVDRAVAALAAGDCDRALGQARGARSWSPDLTEPDLVIAVCAARNGDSRTALLSARRAVQHDPRDWQTHFVSALVKAADGRDPDADLRRARALNPRERLTSLAQADLAVRDPELRAVRARLLPIPLPTRHCGGPSRSGDTGCGDPRLPTIAPGPLVPTVRP